MTTAKARARLRDLGINLGKHPTGALNAITDVAGVCVGHTTVIRDNGEFQFIAPGGGSVSKPMDS